MAEAFLRQLLTTGNRIQSEDHAQCCVCLEVYGTRTKTGAIGREVRLPCNHTLGSMCAFTWLESKNTCPFCRMSLCQHVCDEMGLDSCVVSPIDQMAATIRKGSYPGIRSNHWIAAVSVFIAIHLLEYQMTYEDIGEAMGVAASIMICLGWMLVFNIGRKLTEHPETFCGRIGFFST